MYRKELGEGTEEVGFEAGANKAKKSCFSPRAVGIRYLNRKTQDFSVACSCKLN